MNTTDLLYLVEFYDRGVEREYVSVDGLANGDKVVAALPVYRSFVLDKEASVESQDAMRHMIDAHYAEQE